MPSVALKDKEKIQNEKYTNIFQTQVYLKSTVSEEAQVHSLINQGIKSITGRVFLKWPLTPKYFQNFSCYGQWK